MPELPEVETIVRDIRPRLEGRTIASARLSHDDVLRGVTRRRLLRTLTGARVESVSRRAKHAVLTLSTASAVVPSRRRAVVSTRLVIQPGMTGSLIVHHHPLTAAERRYAVLRAPLQGGGELVYRDVRRLGTLLLLDGEGWTAYDEAIGPEPLEDTWTVQGFHETLRKTRQAVKKVLMDQGKVAGVGNIYANEALFAARIDPSRPAHRVTRDEAADLHRHVRRILEAAIVSNGTTVRDYRTGTGEAGSFQLELLVYGREGQPCRVCGTRLVGTHAIDARITVLCHRCQS